MSDMDQFGYKMNNDPFSELESFSQDSNGQGMNSGYPQNPLWYGDEAEEKKNTEKVLLDYIDELKEQLENQNKNSRIELRKWALKYVSRTGISIEKEKQIAEGLVEYLVKDVEK